MSNPAFKFDHVHIISENPHAAAQWYVEMFGATIAGDTVVRGAPQIFVELGGMTILIRGGGPARNQQRHGPSGPTRISSATTPGAPIISGSCTRETSRSPAPTYPPREPSSHSSYNPPLTPPPPLTHPT